MKKVLLGIIVIGVLVVSAMSIQKENIKREQQEIEEYKTCILAQSESRGWIIRSECSQYYQRLDKQANLTYTQKGYDLYLNK